MLDRLIPQTREGQERLIGRVGAFVYGLLMTGLLIGLYFFCRDVIDVSEGDMLIWLFAMYFFAEYQGFRRIDQAKGRP